MIRFLLVLSFLILLFNLTKANLVENLTPLEKSNYSKLSGYSDMMEYLNQLDVQSEYLEIKTIGNSVQSKEIPALFLSKNKSFGNSRSTRPVVLVFCQQHGNEPSGKEAALILVRRLINNDEKILSKLDLILVPQVNPDGGEMGQRRNANDMDLNRNHVILSEPESISIHNLFLQWMPEVTLDVHEYNAINKEWVNHGYIKDAEEMLGGVTNLNIDTQIINYTRNEFINEVGAKILNDGFSFHRYIVGAPFINNRVRFSTTSINDGRQSMGIYNTLSFLIEGKRYGDLITNIERRTKGQISALWAFLKTVSNHSSEILNIVTTAREKLLQEKQTDFVHIRMDYFLDPLQKTLNYPIFDLNSWHHTEKELENFMPLVKIKNSVKRPVSYIFSQNQTRLIELLKRHQIKMLPLPTNLTLEVEALTIMHITPTTEEDKKSEWIDVDKNIIQKKFKAGDIQVSLNQPAANLIPLLFEPQSSWGIVTEATGRKYRFKEYLQVGQEYPIYRLMQWPIEGKNSKK